MKIQAIGVQFNSGIKVYDFNPESHVVILNDDVLVETIQGKEVGKVVYVNKQIELKKDEQALKPIIKVLNEEENLKLKEARKNKPEEVEKLSEVIKRLHLPMKIIAVEHSIFEDRADVYFTSEGRVDFRSAVKELSRVLRKTLKLKQLGSRDQAKMLGGFGPCGQEVCCKRFLKGLGDVSREKVQNVFQGKNVSKITGICGNFMCCLSFETGKVCKTEMSPKSGIVKTKRK